MIEELHIQHFQSLDDVRIELGGFTCIVGPSSSGKSALTRALGTLISNRRGSSFISHGERIAVISAKTTRGTVTLTRGKGTNDNSYVVVPRDDSEKKLTFTKLGGEVPVEVSAFLGIDPKDPIAFARQFDSPYLLDESGAEVARVLGSLTNATLLLEGARESNRRKLEAQRTLSVRSSDLEAIKERIPGFRALKAQSAALDDAEHALADARSRSDELSELQRALESLQVNQARVEALEGTADFEIPDEQAMLEAARQYAQFRKDLVAFVQAEKQVELAEMDLEQDEDILRIAQEEYQELVGEVSDNMAGWVAGYIVDGKRTRSIGDERFIAESYVVEMMTAFVETRSQQGG